MPKMRKDPAARQDQLVAALWRVVDRDGVDDPTIRSIAEEAGVSVGALQYYFADKDELMQFAATQWQERHRQQLLRKVGAAQRTGDHREVIGAVLRSRLPLTTGQRRRSAVVLAWSIRRRPVSAISDLLAERAQFHCEILSEALAAAQATGRIPAFLDVRSVALGLYAMDEGVIRDLLYGFHSRAGALRIVETQLDVLFGAS